MAKGNMLLGTVSGKVGDVVFYRSNGEQMSRMRIRHIGNPQTEAQQIQRAIAATIVQAYSFMSPIVDHSFEGVPYGQKSMNYFNKINMDALRVNARIDSKNAELVPDEAESYFTAPKITALIPNAYKVSKGSLNNNLGIVKGREYVGPDIIVPTDGYWTAESYEEVKFGAIIKDCLLERPNSMITWIQVSADGNLVFDMSTSEATRKGAQIKEDSFGYTRIKRNDTPWDEADFNKPLTEENVTKLSAKYFDEFDRKFFDAIVYTNATQITVSDESVKCPLDKGAYAAAVIKSELVGNVWKRSTEVMKITMVNDYRISGLTYPNMVEAWSRGADRLGDTRWYLNGGQVL